MALAAKEHGVALATRDARARGTYAAVGVTVIVVASLPPLRGQRVSLVLAGRFATVQQDREGGVRVAAAPGPGLGIQRHPRQSAPRQSAPRPPAPHAPDPLRADTRPGSLPALPRTAGGWATVLADPPWRFVNRTGKVAPEHRRLDRYDTMTAEQIAGLTVADVVADDAHLYLWVPNALVPEGIQVVTGWGFRYVSNLVWAKRRKDGGPDGRGVGFYFRNVTELILFGVRGSMRTLPPGRRQVNLIETRKREHSRKPDEAYDIIESCSPGPYLELFARYPRRGWAAWGDEAGPDVTPRGRRWPAYGAGGPGTRI